MQPTDPVLKVAYVIGQLGLGGSERQLFKKMVHLRDLGLEMVVIAMAEGGELEADFERENFTVYRLRRSHNLEIRRVFQLASILRKERPHIVHGDQYGAGGYARVAGILAGVPYSVLEILSSYPVVRRRYRWAETFLGPRTTAYLVNAEAVKRRTIEHHGMAADKVHVILNVYDPPRTESRSREEMRRELRISEQTLVVGIVASFDAEKNHSLFLRFAREVLQHRTDIVFLCIGDGSERADREAEAAEYGITQYVRFLGMRRDVNDLLGVLDVSVNCSIREGLCNAIIESIAAGIPILASQVGGTPEIVEDRRHGILFASGNVTEMTNGFLEMTEDLPAYRARIAAYLPSFLSSLSADRIAPQQYEFYRGLVEPGQSAPPIEQQILPTQGT